jgi:hypothetical protein
MTEQDLYNELAFYTLAHGDPYFIHQNAVDAFAAQNAGEDDKPIKPMFALIGLYLCVEKGQTGRQAQMAHMRLAKRRRNWPRLPLPEQRGATRVADVLAAPRGPQRDAMIRRWCEDVWATWEHVHATIKEICRKELGIE